MTLTFEPLISSTLWLTLAVALAALLGWYAWKQPWGIGVARWVAIITLMGLSGVAILVILLNPTWLEHIPPPAGKPRLTILVDDSASMGARDMPSNHSRYEDAATAAKTCADKLAGRFEVRVSTFSNVVLPTTAAELSRKTPAGSVTDLALALASSIDSANAAGQWLKIS